MALMFSWVLCFYLQSLRYFYICLLNHLRFDVGAHAFLTVPHLISSFSSAFWIWSLSFVCVGGGYLGTDVTNNLGQSFCLWKERRKKLCRGVILWPISITQKLVFFILFFYTFLFMFWKNSYGCAFPLCSSEKCKLYRMKYVPVHLHFCEEMISKCLNTDSTAFHWQNEWIWASLTGAYLLQALVLWNYRSGVVAWIAHIK